MKKKYSKILLSAFILISSSINAQNLLGIYEFTGVGACPNQSPGVTTQPQFGTFLDFDNVNVNCAITANVFNNNNWNATSTIDLGEYIGFTLTADDCYRINLDSLVFSYKNSTGGVNPTWHLRSNADNYMADIASGVSSSPTGILTTAVDLGAAGYDNLMNINFRIYITNMGGTTSSTFRVDDVKLHGNILFVGPVNFYVDADGDGFGTGAATQMCSNPGGYSLLDTDCNDTDSLINPNSVWFEDLDNDDYGNVSNFQTGCTSTLANATLNGGDCDESNPQINPMTVWYEDADNDGYGNDLVTDTSCTTTTFLNPVLVAGDCMDDQATVYPGALEICDDFDNNCDGDINEDLTFTVYYIDNDGDTYGAGSAGDFCNDPGVGYTLDNTDCDDDDSQAFQSDTLFIDADADGYDNGTDIICFGTSVPTGYMATSLGVDCNDNDATVNPAATDTPGDLIDQNCDGVVDGYLELNEINTFSFSVYPNPGKENITIKLNSVTDGEAIIQSIDGKIVASKKFNALAVTFDTHELSTGIYFIQIRSKNQTNKVKWIKN